MNRLSTCAFGLLRSIEWRQCARWLCLALVVSFLVATAACTSLPPDEAPPTQTTFRAADVAPAPRETYAVFARSSAFIEDDAVVVGKVGVRGEIVPGQFFLHEHASLVIGHFATVRAGLFSDDIFAATAIFRYGSRISSAYVTSLYLGQNVEGFVGTLTLPLPPFPKARPVVAGTVPVTVTSGSTVAVTAGAYGPMIVETGGVLWLAGATIRSMT